jgi:hypothetical protein
MNNIKSITFASFWHTFQLYISTIKYMNYHKLDLYKELKLNDYYWGGAFRINFEKIDLTSTPIVINILDKVCTDEGLIALNELWNEIDYNLFKTILLSAFQFNLGFTAHETMPYEKAQLYYKSVMENFNIETCRCFTNWTNNPWDVGGGGFNAISEHTLNLALSIINNNEMLFIYFLFED